MVNLGIVDEGASQEVPNGLGGQLRVALVHCQLPPRTAATHIAEIIEEGFIKKRWQMSSLLLGRQNHFNSFPHKLFLHQPDLKNWMKSSYPSNRPGAKNPIFQIVLMQIILFF